VWSTRFVWQEKNPAKNRICLVDEDYKPVLDLVLEDKVKISPFTKRFPLSEINEVFEAVHSRKIQQRPVLIP
jgi:D-arabinose 1-dehydrogenase-like Zn-dependent alcohol dehydrogenase